LHDIIVFARRGSQGKSAPLVSAWANPLVRRRNGAGNRSAAARQVPSQLHDTGAFRWADIPPEQPFVVAAPV